MRGFKFFRPLMLAVFLLAIAGTLLACGGGSSTAQSTTSTTSTTTQSQAQAPAAEPQCTAANEAANCVLADQPPPHQFQSPFSSIALQGIDFAWTKFSPQSAGAFGASYLSSDASKNWNPTLIRQYHLAGRGTVAVFEEGGNQAAAGCARGAADARFSEGLLTSWGYPHSHFDMAIDFDASGPQVYDYFRCANAAEPGLVGAYGGYYPLQYLCSKGVIHESWQTYAWSRGLWLPASCAPLEQYLNGSTFDHDRAIATNYGQFPSPRTGPSQGTIHKWRGAREASFRQYHKRHCTLGLDTRAHCNVFASRVVYFQHNLWSVYKRWHCFGPHARKHSEICWVIRPEVSHWSKARDATALVVQRDCSGPVTFPVKDRSAFCDKMRQRERWFAAKVKENLY